MGEEGSSERKKEGADTHYFEHPILFAQLVNVIFLWLTFDFCVSTQPVAPTLTGPYQGRVNSVLHSRCKLISNYDRH